MEHVPEFKNNLKEGLQEVLIGSSESLKTLLREHLPANYDKIELAFFIEYIVSETLKLAPLAHELFWEVEGAFRQKHLFDELILEIASSGGNPMEELNKNAIIASDRMNEYKSIYSLTELMSNPDSPAGVMGLVRSAGRHICKPGSDAEKFASESFILIPIYVSQQQQIQSDLILGGMEELTDKITDMPDQPRENTSNKKSGCFIATYAYGSDVAFEVLALRRYRDHVLVKSSRGRTFIDIYYLISPSIVKWFSKIHHLEFIVKKVLNRLIKYLYS